MQKALWGLYLVFCTYIILTDAKSLDRVRRDALDQTSEPCPFDHYQCDNGKRCILLKSICDGYNDCEDKLDERNCIPTSHNETKPETLSNLNDKLASSTCDKSKFTCDNGAKCLPLTWLCDSIDDCVDKQDEHNCQIKKDDISVAKAAKEAAISAAQQAKRAAQAAQELMVDAKNAASKAQRAMKIVAKNLG